jgi:hypothetical protein
LKAVVTSVGEPTTDLCVWSLKRNGFEVILYKDDSTLWAKLKRAYNELDEDFLRVDADIVPNRDLTPAFLANEVTNTNREVWWWQFLCFDWFKLNTTHAVSFMRKQSLPAVRARVDEFKRDIRPETECSRIAEFYNPRRFDTINQIVGLHGYATRDMKPVVALKANRGQSHLYDFELAKRLNELRGL